MTKQQLTDAIKEAYKNYRYWLDYTVNGMPCDSQIISAKTHWMSLEQQMKELNQ